MLWTSSMTSSRTSGRAQHPHRHILLGRQPIVVAIGRAERFEHRTKEQPLVRRRRHLDL